MRALLAAAALVLACVGGAQGGELGGDRQREKMKALEFLVGERSEDGKTWTEFLEMRLKRAR